MAIRNLIAAATLAAGAVAGCAPAAPTHAPPPSPMPTPSAPSGATEWVLPQGGPDEGVSVWPDEASFAQGDGRPLTVDACSPVRVFSIVAVRNPYTTTHSWLTLAELSPFGEGGAVTDAGALSAAKPTC